MIIWIILLRAVGTLILFVGVLGGATQFLLYVPLYKTPEDLYVYIMPILQNLVYVCVCFGLASGLKHIQRSARQTDQKLNSLGHLIVKRTSAPTVAPPPPFRDLAPVAPNWDDLPEPIPYGGYLDRSIARHKRRGIPDEMIGEPQPSQVRQPPKPARTTPGMEYQYGDLPPAPPPVSPATRPTQYVGFDDPVVDRDMLRSARDKQIRRAQAENARKTR